MAFRSVPYDSLSLKPFTKIGKEWALLTAGDENVVYDDEYFELDVYPFWNDRATLEIELLSEDLAVRTFYFAVVPWSNPTVAS